MSISTPKLSQSKSRCANPKIENLIRMMQRECAIREQSQTQAIKKDRLMNHSISARVSRSSLESRPMFNNKTREGELIDTQIRPVPYLFIPGFKSNDFIAPDRVFQKGNSGKRFTIKMKDTSLLSFRDAQPIRYSKALHRAQKDKTITNRQYQQFNKIIDQNDGKVKASANRWFLKTRRDFKPVHASQFFSECEPLLGPRDYETTTLKKVSLAKTFDYQKKWRPATRAGEVFSASVSNSVYSHAHHVSSVR